jgi:hypothetical protein
MPSKCERLKKGGGSKTERREPVEWREVNDENRQSVKMEMTL